MYPRHRLDLRWGDVVHGLGSVAGAWDRHRWEGRVLERAECAGDGLVTSSVRAAWDLLLTTLAWPEGSEVVVSAVTHPAMATIAAEHGLTVVPVDVDLDTLLPTPTAVSAAVTGNTRAVLVAQLFGCRGDLAGLAGLCHDRGLLLVEDAAQAWCGPRTLRSDADATLVSFGLIKTATALGGALVRVSDPSLLRRLRAAHGRLPVQGRAAYAVRLLRGAGVLLLTRPAVYGTFRAVAAALGADPDVLLDRATRSPVDHRTRRRRPPAPLLALLSRRLRPDDASARRVAARAGAGERLRAALPPGLRPPGESVRRSHWLFPVRCADPARLVAALRAVGLDASASTSNLVALTTEGAAADLMRHVVYLPAYPELPGAVSAVVARLVERDAAEETERPPGVRG